MNERIKLLAEQAYGIDDAKPLHPSALVALDAFAKLIVRECVDIISPYAVKMENFDGGHPITDLKKHFGVEE